jgi:hypothetical protein
MYQILSIYFKSFQSTKQIRHDIDYHTQTHTPALSKRRAAAALTREFESIQRNENNIE